jgi:hypothetical protein
MAEAMGIASPLKSVADAKTKQNFEYCGAHGNLCLESDPEVGTWI